MLGSSVNLLVSDISEQLGYGSLELFSFTSIGIPIWLIGTAYLLLAPSSLLPDRGRDNNQLGVAGITWDVKLMNLKVFDDYPIGASFLNIQRAIRYAADNGANVINLSLGATIGKWMKRNGYYEGSFESFKNNFPSFSSFHLESNTYLRNTIFAWETPWVPDSFLGARRASRKTIRGAK